MYSSRLKYYIIVLITISLSKGYNQSTIKKSSLLQNLFNKRDSESFESGYILNRLLFNQQYFSNFCFMTSTAFINVIFYFRLAIISVQCDMLIYPRHQMSLGLSYVRRPLSSRRQKLVDLIRN